MKTPDEIKRGLECCVSSIHVCEDCPYESCNGVTRRRTCVDELEADALAYIQQLEAKEPKWISVKERLPEEADEVLVFCRNGETTWTNLAHRVGKQWWRVGVPMQCVTHWMPMPEPPEEEP